MTCKKQLLIIIFLSFLYYSNLFAASFKFKNVVQSGFEYDTNIFKTYNTSVSDGVFRALFKSDQDLKWSSGYANFIYRLGGKKNFLNPEQDTIITSFGVDFNKKISEKFSLKTNPRIKYQVENDDVDQNNFDINEDFLLFQQDLSINFSPGKGLFFTPTAEFTLFNFSSAYPTLAYYEQKYGCSTFKSIYKGMQGGFIYSFNRLHFKNIQRTDSLNQMSAVFKYASTFYTSLSYTLQINKSSDAVYNFTNHRVSILASIPITFKRKNSQRTKLDPDFVLSIIGTLRFKNYPSQISIDEEGRRYLLSESEEDNFNIIVLKVTKTFTKAFAAEFKYTRHSNEFASTGDKYRRSNFYLGARLSF